MLISNLFLSLKVVIAVFLIVVLGHVVARKKIISSSSFIDMNKLVFALFLPANIFNSIANGNVENVLDIKFLGYIFLAFLATTALSFLIIPRLENDPRKIGVMIQGAFRGNYLILGFPILYGLYGASILDLSSSVLLISLPLNNIMSILVLSYYSGIETNLRASVINLIKNPIIIATLFGFIALSIELPYIVIEPLRLLGQISTPLALFVLGGLLDYKDFRANWKNLNIVLIAKLIVMPFLFLHIAFLLDFTEQQLMTLMVFSAAPTAVISYSMTLYLGGDARLAQHIIIYTTALSVPVYVFWINYILSIFPALP